MASLSEKDPHGQTCRTFPALPTPERSATTRPLAAFFHLEPYLGRSAVSAKKQTVFTVSGRQCPAGVAIGLEDIDLTAAPTKGDIKEKLLASGHKAKPSSVGILHRFRSKMQIGDRLITYDRSSRQSIQHR